MFHLMSSLLSEMYNSSQFIISNNQYYNREGKQAVAHLFVLKIFVPWK